MSATAFQEELRELYEGELLGEAFFEKLLTLFDTEAQKYKLAVALQLETETKARLRPYLISAGLMLDDNSEARRTGYQLAGSFQGVDWETAMRKLIQILEPAVARYRDISLAAPKEYQELSNSMLIHEESLLEFAQLELENVGYRSIKAIDSQLQYSIPAPEHVS